MEESEMFGRGKRQAQESELDKLGSALVGAARASEDEVEAAISSPVLFSRIQAAIASRGQGPAEAPGSWLGFLAAAKLAVPAMAVLALVAGSVPWFTSSMSREVPSLAVTEPEPGIVSLTASACALSNNQECVISSNEVLATIFAEENQEQQR
jgi:hypothetical protein